MSMATDNAIDQVTVLGGVDCHLRATVFVVAVSKLRLHTIIVLCRLSYLQCLRGTVGITCCGGPSPPIMGNQAPCHKDNVRDSENLG